MLTKLKKLLKKLGIRGKHPDIQVGEVYYSQEGEDIILDKIFKGKSNGYFVDVGAHHPTRYSNTYKFYRKGWVGINIDALPGSMEAFKTQRPKDINLEKAIAQTEMELPFYIFNEPALNTFSEKEAKKKDGLRNFKIVETKMIKTCTLQSVLEEYLPKNKEIDFISIDVEGLDFEVLKSININTYRPRVILLEVLNENIEAIVNDDPIYSYLKAHEYSFFAKTFNTLFFVNNDE
ncbi:MAG: FkbM family methyltransferase [Bacteroidota bacterium]